MQPTTTVRILSLGALCGAILTALLSARMLLVPADAAGLSAVLIGAIGVTIVLLAIAVLVRQRAIHPRSNE